MLSVGASSKLSKISVTGLRDVVIFLIYVKRINCNNYERVEVEINLILILRLICGGNENIAIIKSWR